MTFNLVKNTPFNLKKSDASPLTHVVMGLGWDPIKTKGFLGFGGKTQDVDLDASCLLFDANKSLVDVVWFRQLKSVDGSIVHTGDNRTGDGEGDDEQIRVNLARVPSNVAYLVFTINSFTGQTFKQIQAAACRVLDADTNKETAIFKLAGGHDATAMVMAKVTRTREGWSVTALGEFADGRTVQDMIPLVSRLL